MYYIISSLLPCQRVMPCRLAGLAEEMKPSQLLQDL